MLSGETLQDICSSARWIFDNVADEQIDKEV